MNTRGISKTSQSSRCQGLTSSYFYKVPRKNLRIDIGEGNTFGSQTASGLFNKLSSDAFDGRKNSTRTDGDASIFLNKLTTEDSRTGFRNSSKHSASITPKVGLSSIEEMRSNRKQKVNIKIKSSKSSNRVKTGIPKQRPDVNCIITKDKENNDVYHIMPNNCSIVSQAHKKEKKTKHK